MFPLKRALATAFVVACVMPSLAQATTITLDSLGIVGAVDGVLSGPGGTSPANEEILAEHLLQRAVNSTEFVGQFGHHVRCPFPPMRIQDRCQRLRPCGSHTRRGRT